MPRLIIIVLLLVSLSGCSMLNRLGRNTDTADPDNTAVDTEATVAAAIQATVAAQNGQPTVVFTPSEPTTAAAPETPTVVQGGQQFAIDQRTRSDRSALENIALVLYSAELTSDALTLRIAFENVSDESFTLTGTSIARQAVLRDATGNEYEVSAVSESLRSGIAPSGGFSAGAANVGNLTFPRPAGNAPYELVIPEYEALSFRLDTLLADEDFTLAEGDYPIDQTLRSNREALLPIELQVQSLQVATNQLIFTVAFVNIGRQGYDLMLGPEGADARLLDAERVQYEPAAVSPSLAEGIAPEEGWTPGQAYTGTLTFDLPEASQELRFIFPEYDALTIRLDERGIAEAEVTSPTGGAPQPTATPSASNVAFTELETLLAQQAQALLAGNEDDYLSSFDPLLYPDQQQLFARAAQVPLADYRVKLAPDTSFSDSDLEDGLVDRVPIQISYTLRGINPDNVFTHDAEYTFTRDNTSWRISETDTDENPPFWHTGDFVMSETDHFLIFARPELENELPALEAETAIAYDTLVASGLDLEPRYVAYFTASQDDFSELTGQSAQRVLGIALSRYAFDSDEVVVSSYAFYINGKAFTDEANLLSDADRQTTITHELVHLVLAPVSRPYTPPWVAEGAAVYYSEDVGGVTRDRLLNDGQLDNITLENLTRAETLGEHDFVGQQVGYEYIYSGETFAYLIETFGEDVTMEFYQSYAKVPAADVRDEMPRFGSTFAANAVFANLRAELTEAAVQRFFNRSVEQLDADIKEWLRAAPAA